MPVFVTAFSSNHYAEAINRRLIKTFAIKFPGQKLTVINLGLTEFELSQVSSWLSTLIHFLH